MEADTIPDPIRNFLLKYIDSVGTLEVLLLLYGEPGRQWTAQGVSDNLRTNLTMASAQLEALESTGLASGTAAAGEPKSFRFRGEDQTLEEQVRAIASFYGLRHTSVVEFIHGVGREKVQALADAFKLRKDQQG